jgi:two-component system response regulator FixJ
VEAQPNIFVVDDDSAFLDSLASLLGSMGFTTTCFNSGTAFIRDYSEGDASCLILDLKMPETDGLTVLDWVAKMELSPPAIILTGKGEVPDAVRAMRHGVVAYIQKQKFSEAILWDAIQQALTKDAEQRLELKRRRSRQSQLGQLTPPENLVLDLLLKGKEQTTIAEVLGISRRTVDNRRMRIFKKLGVATLPELIRFAAEAGLLREM